MRKLFIATNFTDLSNCLTLTKNGIFFSSQFMKTHSLHPMRYVRFFFDTEISYKFYLQFSVERKTGSFSLMKSNKRNQGCTTRSQSFISEHKILKDLTEKRKRNENRFEIFYCKHEKIFYFFVLPCFENIVVDMKNLPDVSGIYKYSNKNGETIYYGSGSVKERFRSPERKTWDIAKIEYSIIKKKEDQQRFENFHLKQFNQKFGRLPIFNQNQGKKFTNDQF